jgi:hypothetical protein
MQLKLSLGIYFVEPEFELFVQNKLEFQHLDHLVVLYLGQSGVDAN